MSTIVPKTEKIAKYLAECGIASRRKSEELVRQGLVFVNGKRMADVARRIDPLSDKIVFDGKAVKQKSFVYYLLNKPAGYTSSTADPHAKNLVTGLVPKNPPVWPVGRLDRNTEGLMILTNDGALTQRLTHPKYQREKEYMVKTGSPLEQSDIRQIQNGLTLEDGFIRPDKFKVLAERTYKIILHSGKKRVVRRIIEKVGHRVMELKRVKMDSLVLDDLPAGKWRDLTSEEINNLLKEKRPSSGL